jgi:hypothetical protein
MVASRKVQNGSTQEPALPGHSQGDSGAAVPRKYPNSTIEYQPRAVTFLPFRGTPVFQFEICRAHHLLRFPDKRVGSHEEIWRTRNYPQLGSGTRIPSDKQTEPSRSNPPKNAPC